MPNSLDFLHALLPVPFAHVARRPPENPDYLFKAFVTLFGERHDFVGHGEYLKLFILFPQPSVEFPSTDKTRVETLLNIPYGDLAVKRVKVKELAGILIRREGKSVSNWNPKP